MTRRVIHRVWNPIRQVPEEIHLLLRMLLRRLYLLRLRPLEFNSRFWV
jgi:hypothetical protein